MLGRMVMMGVLMAALVGCSTTEALVESDSASPESPSSTEVAGEPSSDGHNSRSSASESVTTTAASSGDADDVSENAGSSDIARMGEQVHRKSTLASADATPGLAGAGADPALDRAPVSIDPSGLPLEEVMTPREGLRLVFDVSTSQANAGDAASGTATGDPRAGLEGALPTELTLILQPSRAARADISVHGSRVAGYLVMEETETLWQPATVAGDHPLTQALAEFAYPRYLPPESQSFRSVAAADPFLVRAAGVRAWQLVYDSGTTVRIGNFLIEPMALDGGGPETIVVTPSTGQQAHLTLRSAAVYREREISGAVVSAFGRPLSGITVAPHPQVGRLPASRVAVTDTLGAFTLPYRAAPGDSIRLFYGRTIGSEEEARIANPQEIRGRVASPDFATLIFAER